jgi:PAS domain S-box-containing protein
VTDGSAWPLLATGVLGDEARNVLDAIAGGVILQDARGFAVYANAAALELIGLSFDEISGAAPIREGWRATDEKGDDLGLEEQPAAAALRTGETQQLLVGITLPDGGHRWLWNEAVAVTGRSGQPELVISSFIDLTARRTAEERLELAIDAGRTGIWDWNIPTNDLVWSEHVERLFGLAPEEFEGTFEAFLVRVHPDDRQAVREAITTAVQQGGRYETELRVVWPDDSVHWLLAVGEVYRNTDGEPVRMLGVTRDITARREAELERESNEQRLSFLIEATTVLSESFEYEATLGRLAHLVVPLLADWCAIDLLGEDRTFRRVASVGAEPETGDVAALVSVPRRVRAGASELRSDVTGGELGDVRSLIVAPLPSRGQVVGALWLGISASGRRYDVDDLMLVEELARRVALAVENARLYEDRRRVADTLQASLLPPTLPSVPGINVGAAYRASGEGNDIGGDFYDVFEIGDGAWAAVIGDVCGKGTGAAALTGLARHTLRAAALGGEAPSGVLSLLNDAIMREQSDDRFLTAVFCRIVPTEEGGARVVLARGGHMPPLLRRADGTVRPLGHPGLLLGSFPDVKLADDTIELGPGDMIVLCTDGVTEAWSADGIFGPDRLRDLVAGCGGLDAQAVADRVKHAALDFQPGLPRDDVAVLVLRVTGR